MYATNESDVIVIPSQCEITTPGGKGSCQLLFGGEVLLFHQIHQHKPSVVQYYHSVTGNHMIISTTSTQRCGTYTYLILGIDGE